MESISVDFSNFHLRTFANWTSVSEAPNREPDFRSDSGSEYWFEGDAVIRSADHWLPRIASCSWLLDGGVSYRRAVATCKLSDFYIGMGNGYFDNNPKRLWPAVDGKMVFSYTAGEAEFGIFYVND